MRLLRLPFSADEIRHLSLHPPVQGQTDGTRLLLEPWHYEDTEGRLTVPAGFRTDYSSIPHRLSWLMPPWWMLDLAGIGHDFLSREPPFDDIRRARADRAWGRIALAQGNSTYSVWKGYRALRLFGWTAYGARNPHVVAP